MVVFVNAMCHKKLGVGKTIGTTREVRCGDGQKEREIERERKTGREMLDAPLLHCKGISKHRKTK